MTAKRKSVPEITAALKISKYTIIPVLANGEDFKRNS